MKEKGKSTKDIEAYLDKWVQRTFELLHSGYVYNPDLTIDKILDFDNFASKFEIPESQFITNIELTRETEYECILPKTHSNQFAIEGVNLADVKPEFFEKLIVDSINIRNKNYDVVLQDFKSKSTLYVYLKDPTLFEREEEEDGKKPGLYRKVTKTNKTTGEEFEDEIELGRKIKIKIQEFKRREKTKNSDGTINDVIISEYFRMDDRGNKMYQVPSMNTKVYKNKFGEEILYIEKSSSLKSLIESSSKIYPFVNVNDHKFAAKQTYSEVLKASSLISENRNLLRKKQDRLYKEVVGEESTLKQDLQELTNKYVAKLVNIHYQSFQLSLYNLAARIPSQALQSMMPMKTVAYTNDSSNNGYVSH